MNPEAVELRMVLEREGGTGADVLLQESLSILDGLGVVAKERASDRTPSGTEHVRLHGSGDNPSPTGLRRGISRCLRDDYAEAERTRSNECQEQLS